MSGYRSGTTDAARDQFALFLSFLLGSKIVLNEFVPLYQKLEAKIKELKALKMMNTDIAKRLKISTKTVRKGIK